MSGHDPGDPGPATHLDPKVSRLVYELRDAGVRTQAGAIRAIADREGAGLMPGQIATLLWQFPPPPELVGPEHELHDEGDDDPPGVSWADRGRGTGGPGYVPPDQRGAKLRRIAPVEFAPPEQRST